MHHRFKLVNYPGLSGFVQENFPTLLLFKMWACNSSTAFFSDLKNILTLQPETKPNQINKIIGIIGIASIVIPTEVTHKQKKVYFKVIIYIPYARHYNPQFVYFLPHFSVRFIIKSG